MTTALTMAAEVVSILLALVDRDPKQPRFAENVDTELEGSFRAHGWLEAHPLEIRPHPEKADRFMLVDGERRYAGAKAAGLKEALCIITYEAEGSNEADRLMRQLLHNTGKPLTAVEEALAFKRIIDAKRAGTPETLDLGELHGKPHGEAVPVKIAGKPPKDADPKYGPTQLARDLGLPKSTVTDRLAATEIAEFWLKFVVHGPLQSSHVPDLHRIREMPVKYQLRVLTRLQAHHEWPTPGGKPLPGSKQPSYRNHRKSEVVKDERIRVDDFRSMLDDALTPFVRPLSDVGKKEYKGPTARLTGRGWNATEAVMAIDPAQWEPILRKRQTAKAAKTRAAGGKAASDKSAWEKQQTARNNEYARQREEEARQLAIQKRATPALVQLFEDAIAKAGHAQLRAFALAALMPGYRVTTAAKKAIGGANTAEALLRALAVGYTAHALDSAAKYLHSGHEVRVLARPFGVDVAAALKTAGKASPPAESGETTKEAPADA